MPSFDITAVKASGPGALDGFQFRCAHSGCTEVAGFSTRTMTEHHAAGHELWHETRDRERAV